jgi:hypothetical protein
VNKQLTPTVTKQETQFNDELPSVDDPCARPHWTQHLMAFQRNQLKKGYRIKTTQRKARLMRQIRRTTEHALKEINKSLIHTEKTRAINYEYTQYDTTRAYVNKTTTCDQTHLCVDHSKAESGEAYLLCMNAFSSPTHKKKQKHRHVKTRLSNQHTTPHHKFSPITIPGTLNPQTLRLPRFFNRRLMISRARTHLIKLNLHRAVMTRLIMSLKISTCITKLSIATNLNQRNPMPNLLPDTKQ